MRILNDHELDAVAGGQGHTVAAKLELQMKPTTKSKSSPPMHTLTVGEDDEDNPGNQEPGGGGGDDGGGEPGGGDTGGGDTGDGDTGSDAGEDQGGDDGHGNEVPDTNAPVDNAENDIELAKVESNPKAEIKLTCNTENGSKTCVSGNADHFIVTVTDKFGSTTAYACGLNGGYSVAWSLDLFKSIRGGSFAGDVKSNPAFDCKTLPKAG